MQDFLKPIRAESLKEVFVTRFEELILSGKIAVGQKLPSERELALQLGVSRPVVHEGLVDLAAKGLVTMRPRVGTTVNDYRREGSLVMLESLLNYQRGRLEPGLLQGLLDMRRLFETETARLAARCRTDVHLQALEEILSEEKLHDPGDAQGWAHIDFRFHHLLAMASSNPVYPLLLNSFKGVYLNLTGQFFQDPSVVPAIIAFHEELAGAVNRKDEEGAARVMDRMLSHGETHLRRMIATST